ncbi:endonuclease III domain-containing protein [Corynebacterium mendelii]|uniref:HhH-GPD domain-containing protein n=1 Tax=Corynebacterium mendelii TaxID=2765362 RepID=A0A939DZE5_9CORY|nr:hypothetical protein [Corynebacterium mendelii]MBN9643634.1 hypothetical protein [Corynebacterium mendelii]
MTVTGTGFRTPTPLSLSQIDRRLSHRVTTGVWWPAETDFEIAVGAVLTQNTAWTNVEHALDNLRREGLLSAPAITAADTAQLAELIRPAGYYNAKTRYLRQLAAWMSANHDRAHNLPTGRLRRALLSVTGIGPETADDIVLYVYNRPVFIFDLYARRMLTAAGYTVPAGYEAARRELSETLGVGSRDAQWHQRFHGLVVDAGKTARTRGWDSLLAPVAGETTGHTR